MLTQKRLRLCCRCLEGLVVVVAETETEVRVGVGSVGISAKVQTRVIVCSIRRVEVIVVGRKRRLACASLGCTADIGASQRKAEPAEI